MDKDKVVTMVEKYGALWMLDIAGGVALLGIYTRIRQDQVGAV